MHIVSPSSGDRLSLSALFLQHETVQTELRDRQEDMDQLISTVEDLQRELLKVPVSDASSIQRDMETLRDQWLEVSAASEHIISHLFGKKSLQFLTCAS